MTWITDQENPDAGCISVDPLCNWLNAPGRLLGPGHQGLDVFLVQTALTCQPSGGLSMLSNPDADLRILSVPKSRLAGSPAVRPGSRMFAFPGAAPPPPMDTADGAAVIPNWMHILRTNPLAYRYCLQGMLGSLMRSGHPKPPRGMSRHGVFCRNTQAAVWAYQQRYGLAATGCVEPLTWQRLFPACYLRLCLTPAVAPAKPRFGRASPLGSGAGQGNSSGQAGNQPSSQAGSGAQNAAQDDDKKHELELGLNSDGTLSLEYTYTLSQRSLGSWLLSDDVKFKQGPSFELHQPYSPLQSPYVNFKYQLTLEDAMKFGGEKFTVDGFAEGAVQLPADRLPSSTSDATVALHLGVDFNLDLPKVTGVGWLPKLVLEGTAGPEEGLGTINNPSQATFKLGGELKLSKDF